MLVKMLAGAPLALVLLVGASSHAQIGLQPAPSAPAASQPATAPSATIAVPGAPPVPSVATLDAKRPKCPDYSIQRSHRHLMEKCRALWEEYRELHIEGYNESLKTYKTDLDSLNDQLQSKVPAELSSEQYQRYRKIISDEIVNATTSSGKYVKTYLRYFQVYRDQVKLLIQHLNDTRGARG